MHILKATHGLGNAPVQWHRKVLSDLGRRGWYRLQTKPCFYALHDQGTLVGMIVDHVDDFQIAGDGSNSKYCEEIEKMYTFGKWQSDREPDGYMCCGVQRRPST